MSSILRTRLPLSRSSFRRSVSSTSSRPANSSSPPHEAHKAASSATSGSGQPSSNPLGPSRTPLVLGALAVSLVGGYYTFANKAPPKTGSVKAIERALEPKAAANAGEKPSAGIVKRAQ